MPDINKNIHLNINVPNMRDVKSLEDALQRIDKTIASISKRKTVDQKELAAAQQKRAAIVAELSTVKQLATVYEKIAAGQKLSVKDTATATKYIREQYQAMREQEKSAARLAEFQKQALRSTRMGETRSKLMAAGYNIKDANVLSKQLVDADIAPEDAVQHLQDEAQRAKTARAEKIDTAIAGVKTAFAIITKAGEALNRTFKEIFNTSVGIKDSFREVMNTVGEVLDMRSGAATYSTGTSLITNRAARGLRLQYGLSGAQAYGFQTASSMLGMDTSSLEDLAYMNADQRELFVSYMERYSRWFDNAERSGMLRDVQQLQLEFADFKMQLSYDFLSWMVENKETIKKVFAGILKITEVVTRIGETVAKGVGGVTGWFAGMQLNQTSEDIARASDRTVVTGSRTIYNINVSAENNVSGVISDQAGLESQLDRWAQDIAGNIAAAAG